MSVGRWIDWGMQVVSDVDWNRVIFFVLLTVLVIGVIHIGTDLCDIRRLLEARIPEAR